MLHDKVPTDIQSTLKIRTWIVENFAKIFKGSVAGGVIGAIGCWYIYYQQSRK